MNADTWKSNGPVFVPDAIGRFRSHVGVQSGEAWGFCDGMDRHASLIAVVAARAP